MAVKSTRLISDSLLEKRYETIRQDPKICAEDKQLILGFLNHLALGKRLGRKKRRSIQAKTLYKYAYIMQDICHYLNKPLKKIAQADIDLFRQNLKKGAYGKFSSNTMRDIEYKVLRMFFIWLGKEELVDYTDDYREFREVPALKREQVDKMGSALKLVDKLTLWLLFDGGFRAEEFLNIKYSDVKDEERKSKGYYKIRIRQSKTKPRTLSVALCTDLLDEWLKTNKDKIHSDNYLIPISYNHLRMKVERWAQKYLKLDWVTPHVLRHSSVTYYCKLLNQYQLCLRYGWSMSSDMPKRYIDREGVEEEVIGDKIMNDEAITFREENKDLKEQVAQMNETLSQLKSQMDQMAANYAGDLKERTRPEKAAVKITRKARS